MAVRFRFRRVHIVITVCALVGVIAIAMAFSARSLSKSAEPALSPVEIGPVAVPLSEAVSQQVSLYIQATGSFVADETSDVAPETSGQVVATPVDVGAFVKEGSVIVRLDDSDARLRLGQAQAAERQAAAAVRQAEARLGIGPDGQFDVAGVAEVRAARQNYEAAEAQAKLAETNARRYESLVEMGDVSRALYDQMRTQAETARAQANAARQQMEVARNVARQGNVQVAQAQAGLEAARSQVALAQKAVADTTIRAPFSGYISDRPVAAGEYVTPAAKVATLMRTNPIKLRLQLPEADAGRVRPGMAATVTVSAYAGQEFTGRVRVINPAIDPASRTVIVEVDISNPANTLRPNMFATGRIMQPGGGQGVFVPRSAVIVDASTTSARVYVVEGDAARLRVVQLGEAAGELVRIVSGVTAGEEVATGNLDQLFDGAPVSSQ